MARSETPLMWGEPPVRAEVDGRSGFHLPAGTVTLLMSDIEASTWRWSELPDGMERAVADSYAILGRAITCHDGVRPVEQGEGDSVVGAFSGASDALAAALQAQLALRAHDWPDGVDLRVRVALHTADAQPRDDGNDFGLALSRCARLRAIAHGGQTLLSRATRDLVVDRLPDHVDLRDCGEHRLRDLGRAGARVRPGPPRPGGEPGALRSLDAFSNNLPDQLTSFVGRARELAQLPEALDGTPTITPAARRHCAGSSRSSTTACSPTRCCNRSAKASRSTSNSDDVHGRELRRPRPVLARARLRPPHRRPPR